MIEKCTQIRYTTSMSQSYTDKFKGTANYYAQFRPGYPEDFFKYIKTRHSLNTSKRILDVGCGTGQIAIPLSPYVKEVIAMDPEPEMINVAKKISNKLNIKNIHYIIGGSNDFSENENSINNIDLITFGTSFHWMDGSQTLAKLKDYINPKGGICIVYSQSVWNNPNEWQKIVKETIQDHLGETRKAGSGTYKKRNETFHDSLKKAGFQSIEKKRYVVDVTRDLDNIVGLIYSMSFSSTYVLGDKKEKFEQDLKKRLTQFSPNNVFEETITTESISAFI